MLWLDQWYAFADEYVNHVDAKLVDLLFVQKRSDNLATTHHPNILPGRARKLCANGLIGSLTSSNPVRATPAADAKTHSS